MSVTTKKVLLLWFHLWFEVPIIKGGFCDGEGRQWPASSYFPTLVGMRFVVQILSPSNNGDWMVCMHLSKGELELMEHEANQVFSHLIRASIFYGVFFFFF